MGLMSVDEVAAVTRRHRETVASALRSGELHGFQAKKRAHWVIEESCALAWRLGQKCPHAGMAVAA